MPLFTHSFIHSNGFELHNPLLGPRVDKPSIIIIYYYWGHLNGLEIHIAHTRTGAICLFFRCERGIRGGSSGHETGVLGPLAGMLPGCNQLMTASSPVCMLVLCESVA